MHLKDTQEFIQRETSGDLPTQKVSFPSPNHSMTDCTKAITCKHIHVCGTIGGVHYNQELVTTLT